MRSPLEYLQIASEVKALIPSKFNTLSTADKLKVITAVFDVLKKHNVTMDEIGTLLHSSNSILSLIHI